MKTFKDKNKSKSLDWNNGHEVELTTTLWVGQWTRYVYFLGRRSLKSLATENDRTINLVIGYFIKLIAMFVLVIFGYWLVTIIS